MKKGWISLHRKILDWEWYDDLNVRVVFIHCLLRANFKDQMLRGELIKRGEFVTGRKELAKEVGLSVQQIRTALSKLKSTNELTIKTTRKGTRITICNYESYQDISQDSNHQANQQDNQKVTTINNVINKDNRPSKDDRLLNGEKNEVEKRSESVTAEMVEQVYKHYPRKVKKQLGLKAIKKAIKKLCKDRDLSVSEVVRTLEKKVKLYAKATEGKDKRYIPHPATWFNGEEYLDDPKSWSDWRQSEAEQQKRNNYSEGQSQQKVRKQYREELTAEEAQRVAEEKGVDFSPAHFAKVPNKQNRYYPL